MYTYFQRITIQYIGDQNSLRQIDITFSGSGTIGLMSSNCFSGRYTESERDIELFHSGKDNQIECADLHF